MSENKKYKKITDCIRENKDLLKEDENEFRSKLNEIIEDESKNLIANVSDVVDEYEMKELRQEEGNKFSKKMDQILKEFEVIAMLDNLENFTRDLIKKKYTKNIKENDLKKLNKLIKNVKNMTDIIDNPKLNFNIDEIQDSSDNLKTLIQRPDMILPLARETEFTVGDILDYIQEMREELDMRGGKKKIKKRKRTNKRLKKRIRKHKGINQDTGRLKRGYKYSGKKLKSGLSEIIKVKKK